VPLVGGDGTNAAWFANPNMFFAGTTFKYVAIGAARYAVQLGKPKVGFLYCGEASPCRDAYNAVRTPQAQSQFGYQLVYSAQVSLTQPDFTSECLAAKSAGVQALQLGMDANSVSRVARSCSQQGYRPQYITASLAVINDIASDPNVDGMVASVATFPWMANDLPAEHDYWSAIQQYDPGLPLSAAGSEAWVSGLLLKAASANLPANPTSADILQGLWTIKGNDFGGLSPPVTFNRGQPAADAPCYYAIRVQGLKWIAPSGSKPQC
jgi:branched-chain amino acid transport system substrate-binding protein